MADNWGDNEVQEHLTVCTEDRRWDLCEAVMEGGGGKTFLEGISDIY